MGNSKPYFVSLTVRKIVLRVILISSLSSFVMGVVLGVPILLRDFDGVQILTGGELIGLSIIPLSVSLHHILRLWPRNKWSARTDLIYSAVELCFVTGYLIAETVIIAEYVRFLTIRFAGYTGFFDSLTIWEFILQVAVVLLWISTTASFVITIWNLRASEYRTIGLRFDFMENHNDMAIGWRKSRIGRWSLLFGENIFRKRFGTERVIVRGLRAAISILCLFGMIALGYLVLIFQPMQQQLYFQSMTTIDAPDGSIFQEVTMHVAVIVDDLREPPTLFDVDITWQPDSQHITCHAINSIQFACNDVPNPFSPYAPNSLTIKINYTRALSSPPPPPLRTGIYLNLNTDSIGDYLAKGIVRSTITLPIQLYPGLHLLGTTFYSFKDTYTNSRDLAFGIPHFNRQLITNVQALIPDPEFKSSPSDNATASLRLAYKASGATSQLNYEIQREQSTNSVVSGFALLGGIWTFINGLFAAIFGCSLLLVLWGIKPLSIYGLVHLFQGRRSLVDGGYVLSAEEQSRTIALL